MSRRGAHAVDDEGGFVWPPPPDEPDGYDADPPTQPIDHRALAAAIARSAAGSPADDAPEPLAAAARLPAPPARAVRLADLPAGADELEWPPSAASMSGLALVSVETGRDYLLDPVTGKVVEGRREPVVRRTPTISRVRVESPAPARPVFRRPHVVLAALALVALLASSTVTLWRLTFKQVSSLPAVRPPRLFLLPAASPLAPFSPPPASSPLPSAASPLPSEAFPVPSAALVPSPSPEP